MLGKLRPGAIILRQLGSDSVDYAALAQLNLLGQIRARGYRFSSAAQAVTAGAIGGHYRQLGGPHSLLGLPRATELGVPGGRWQLFQHGRMYWSTGTWAHEVHGAIRARWAALGWEQSVL